MSKINDGGTAFPCVRDVEYEGMSLRDYFAAKAPNMDIADICNVMEWDVTLPIGGPEDDQAISQEETVWTRWRELTLWQRLAADAKYRYLFADAMLAAKGGGPC